jgi:hypothetical protein
MFRRVRAILNSRASVIPQLGAAAALPEPPMPTPPKKKRQRKSGTCTVANFIVPKFLINFFRGSAAEKTAEQGVADPDAAPIVPSPKRRKTAAKANTEDAENAALVAALLADPVGATKSKMYIPKPRTGGWAILMALRKHKLSLPIDAPYTGIPKGQLLVLAQPLSDTPMEAPKGEFYGGWSSSKQLKKHGYISSYRVSHNVFFRITDTGLDVAQRCETTNQAMQQNDGDIMIVDDDASDEEDDLVAILPSQPVAPASGSTKARHPVVAESMVIDVTDVDADEAYAKWLQEQFDRESLPATQPLPAPPARGTPAQGSPPSQVASSANSQSPSVLRTSSSSVVPEAAPLLSMSPVALKYDKHLYDIVVLVDYREVTSRGVESPAVMMTNFMQRLRDNDVRCENRALELGDVMWILRPKPEALGSGGPVPLDEEIVMDCIMERKTIDDLFSSFADKRYEEQKSRLRVRDKLKKKPKQKKNTTASDSSPLLLT